MAKVDRFGWYIDQVSSHEGSDDKVLEQRRELKWIEMISKWDTFMKSKRDVVARRVKKGIPDTFRSRAWGLILKINEVTDDFGANADKSPLDCYGVINKDLSRSFPQVGYFSNNVFIDKLRHVLYAYAQVDSDLGYTQGMNFIAGMLLMYMDEELAFKSLYQIMKNRYVNHRDYLAPPFNRLGIANRVFMYLIERKYRKIFQNLNKRSIQCEMFTSAWFMTAFQNLSWCPELQLRIFDRFVFYGTRALHSFGLVIFSRHKDILLNGDIEVVLPVLQKPDESERMKDWKYVIKKWDEHWLSKSEYERALRAVGAPKEDFL